MKVEKTLGVSESFDNLLSQDFRLTINSPNISQMPFKFEKLIVWQKALDLSDAVNKLVKKFPKDELYILTSQFKRAADSVALNIAEGSTGQTNREFNRFLRIALRSNIEVASCIFLAKRRSYISDPEFNQIYKMCEEILLMINSLRYKLL